MYVPKLRRNLIASNKFDIKSATFIWKNQKSEIISKSGWKQISFKLKNSLYVINTTYPENIKVQEFSTETEQDNADIWHRMCYSC